jgi:hypothetical protein
MAGPRLDRELVEMIGQLETQLGLLERYSHDAFELGQTQFLPEVATKLRVLLVRSGRNRPLLFDVAKGVGFTPIVTLSGPPIRRPAGEKGPGDHISVDAFFDLDAVGVQTSTGFVMMTKRQLIRAWSEQLGGAHEDWSVDEALVNAIRTPVSIGGVQPTVIELRNCASTTLRVGRHVLETARASLADRVA